MVGRLAQTLIWLPGVASRTAPGHRRCRGSMVENASRPGCGRVVAGIALRTGADVRRRLGLCVLGQVATTVATCALAIQTSVAHHCRRPGNKTLRMTGVALHCGRNVLPRLGQGISGHITAAMTGRAGGTRHGAVTHLRRLERNEAGTAVATVAGSSRRRDVRSRRAKCICCAVMAFRTRLAWRALLAGRARPVRSPGSRAAPAAAARPPIAGPHARAPRAKTARLARGCSD